MRDILRKVAADNDDTRSESHGRGIVAAGNGVTRIEVSATPTAEVWAAFRPDIGDAVRAAVGGDQTDARDTGGV